MVESIPFDRAVDYYDRTRALTPGTETAMVETISAELGGRGRVLEIGIGTGRIALPLRAAGVDVAGIDLSLPMLQRLLGKGPAPVAAADATRLPFRSGSFGAAISVHVLHLIPRWAEAVRELVRVVEPGGVILVSQGSWDVVAYLDVIDAFSRAAGLERRHPGLNEEAELDALMTSLGATPRDVATIRDTRRGTLRDMVTSLGDGLYSFTWSVEDDDRRRAAGEAAAFAEEAYGDLEEARDLPTQMRWRAYDLA
ncbi:MAG: class I SAM-dependent methyltransferase [Actinomycetota bacterium]|nr:class I SAM-dependent methyltransferase [Actinomycetota bacterium]